MNNHFIINSLDMSFILISEYNQTYHTYRLVILVYILLCVKMVKGSILLEVHCIKFIEYAPHQEIEEIKRTLDLKPKLQQSSVNTPRTAASF